jgi:hypothetical protein
MFQSQKIILLLVTVSAFFSFSVGQEAPAGLIDSRTENNVQKSERSIATKNSSSSDLNRNSSSSVSAEDATNAQSSSSSGTIGTESSSSSAKDSLCYLQRYNIISLIGKGAAFQQNSTESGTGGAGALGINLRNYAIEWNVSLNTSTIFPEVGDGAYRSAVISPTSVGFSAFLDASFLPFRAEDNMIKRRNNWSRKFGFYGALSLNPSVWSSDSTRKQMLILQTDLCLQFLPYENDAATVVLKDATSLVMNGNISVSLMGGFTMRNLTGDAANDDKFLSETLESQRSLYYGGMVKSVIRYNGISLAVSYIYFPKNDKNIEGITGGQIITSFSVTSPFATSASARVDPHGLI